MIKKTLVRNLGEKVCALLLSGIAAAQAQTPAQTTSYVPSTVSPQAQAILRSIGSVNWETRRAPKPDDLANWKRRREAHLAGQLGPGERVAQRENVTLRDMTLGGVSVLEVLPNKWKENERIIIYTHGGAYTMSSARGRLLAIPSLSNAAGIRVISVDYTTAPEADWSVIQSQALSVVQALLQQGYE